MKKLKVLLLCALCATPFLAGCKKSVDYSDYISEMRYGIWLYSNDGLEVKIYRSAKENPYISDGIKSEMCDLTEVYVTLPKNYDGVCVSLDGVDGEMNYRAVENCYYLSFSNGVAGNEIDVTLTYNGESATYTALNVLYDGVITCRDAVNCVIEHDRDLFTSRTENGIFSGEIYVRLLYDEGCYYYVGVCGTDKVVTAYLVDGETGKIIATKQLQG